PRRSPLSLHDALPICDQVAVVGVDGQLRKTKITQLYAFEGLKQAPVETASAGEIIALAGIEDINIGDTVTSAIDPRPLPRIRVRSEEHTSELQSLTKL